MNEKIKAHVETYNKSKGYSTDEESLIETIKECGTRVCKEDEDSHRWWNQYFYVVELDGMLIGYVDAESTGDSSPSDLGYEFPVDCVCEVEETEVMYKTYKPKK